MLFVVLLCYKKLTYYCQLCYFSALVWVWGKQILITTCFGCNKPLLWQNMCQGGLGSRQKRGLWDHAWEGRSYGSLDPCTRYSMGIVTGTPFLLLGILHSFCSRETKGVSTLLPVMLQIRVLPASTTDSDYLTHHSDYTLWRRMDLLGNDIRMISEDPLCIRQRTLGHQKWYFAIQHNKLWCSGAFLVPMNCNQDKWNSMAFHTITGIKQSFQ